MSINPETRYAGKINSADANYPYGSARNITTPGDGTGTPWEEDLVNDIFGFQQSLLSDASIVPSGSPDKVGASQYLEATKVVANIAGDIINVALHPYDVDLTGASDASTALSSAGTGKSIKKVYLPGGVYRLNSNASMDADVDLILGKGVTFVGVGEITGLGITDQSIMSSTNRVRATADSTDGSFFGEYISFRKSGAPTAASESDGLLVIATTDQDSSSFDADLVGIGGRAYIPGSNSNGRAWAFNAFARISAGGDGLLHGIEINIENGGSDNAVPDSAKAKYGLNISTKPGSNPGTAAIKFSSGSDWHFGLWGSQTSLVNAAASRFIELDGVFSVDRDGKVAIGTNSMEGELRLYSTTDTQMIIETDTVGIDSAYINYRDTGTRNWSAGLDATDGFYKITRVSGVQSGSEAMELAASSASQQTALLLEVNNGTTTTVKRVEVGAADSGGTGYRELRVTN